MPAVPIRNTRPSPRVVTEPIPDVGDAVLGSITAFPSTWLIGAQVGRRIRNLIGP